MESGELVCSEFYCQQADISREPIYYTTTTTMPPSSQGRTVSDSMSIWMSMFRYGSPGAIRNMSVLPLPMFQTATTATPAKAKGLRARQ